MKRISMDEPSSWHGLSMRHLSLALLMLQTPALYLLLHYSRIMPLVDGHRFFASTTVLLSEIVKLSLSLTFATSDIALRNTNLSATEVFSRLFHSVFSTDCWMMALPALLYTVQNTLQYTAASNVDASTMHITYQLRIIPSAVFGALLLRRSLSARKCLSLAILVGGVVIVIWAVSLPHTLSGLRRSSDINFWVPRSLEDLEFGQHRETPTAGIVRRSATYQGIERDEALLLPDFNLLNALLAILSASLTSAMAGTLMERVLKTSAGAHTGPSNRSTSLWIRNVQLSLFALFPALFIGVMFVEGDQIARHGFFTGYNWAAWACIGLQAAHGMLAALAINYSDNVTKGIMTSAAIIPSFVGSVIFFNLPATFLYILGMLFVLGASIAFNIGDSTSSSSPNASQSRASSPVKEARNYYDDIAHKDIESVHLPAPSMRFGDTLTTSRPGTPAGFRQKSRSPSKGRRALS